MEFEWQIPLPLRYKSIKIELSYRMDTVVEGRLTVEGNTVDSPSTRGAITNVHETERLFPLCPCVSAVGRD